MAKKFEITDSPECEQCEYKEICTSSICGTAYGILLDCEGFYYVFKELEKKDFLFQTINASQTDLLKHFDENLNKPLLSHVMIVNGAMAVELALKYLLFAKDHSFPCIHNLEKLFHALPEIHKNKLKVMLYEKAHQDEKTLSKNLHIISNTFEEWRYFFQTDAVGRSFFFNDFVHIICEYVLSYKKED